MSTMVVAERARLNRPRRQCNWHRKGLPDQRRLFMFPSIKLFGTAQIRRSSAIRWSCAALNT